MYFGKEQGCHEAAAEWRPRTRAIQQDPQAIPATARITPSHTCVLTLQGRDEYSYILFLNCERHFGEVYYSVHKLACKGGIGQWEAL
jgi:hypothetical protein